LCSDDRVRFDKSGLPSIAAPTQPRPGRDGLVPYAGGLAVEIETVLANVPTGRRSHWVASLPPSF
jgi:hypothetical protein